MSTRSGANYLTPYKCTSCNEFYGSEMFGYKCSACSGFSKSQEDYIKECDEWASSRVVDHDTITFLRSFRYKDDILLLNAFSTMEEPCWILAEDALKLFLYNPTHVRGLIVASKVLDWWNINSKTTQWPAYLSCYYGNFNEPISGKSIPPRMPNKLLL
jgi:hypothetical protein